MDGCDILFIDMAGNIPFHTVDRGYMSAMSLCIAIISFIGIDNSDYLFNGKSSLNSHLPKITQ